MDLERLFIEKLDEGKVMLEEVKLYFDDKGGVKNVIKAVLCLTVDVLWWLGAFMVGLVGYLTNRGVEAVMSLIDNPNPSSLSIHTLSNEVEKERLLEKADSGKHNGRHVINTKRKAKYDL